MLSAQIKTNMDYMYSNITSVLQIAVISLVRNKSHQWQLTLKYFILIQYCSVGV